MPRPSRILQTNSGQLPAFTAAGPPEPPLAVDSDVVVILAALLCALICVVGLAAVARCAWTRRSNPGDPPPAANKGLKKKALESIPKAPYTGCTDKLAECAICLAEFVQGEEVRILPQCGHVFHVACVDTWLGSHSSCPSCRRIFVSPAPAPPQSTCRMCGSSSAESTAEIVAKSREDGEGGSFLP